MPRRVLLHLCFALLTAVPSAPVAPSQLPATVFTVVGGRLLKNGSEFVVHGVTVPGPGSRSNRAVIRDVDAIFRLWRFNLVRMACSVKPLPAREPNDLDAIVRAFTARGIVVLIDPIDHVGGLYQDPPKPPGTPSLDDLAAWYQLVATRYRGNPYVWFTVMSSPGSRDDRRGAEPWLTCHERIIQTIRHDAGADNVIVCEGRCQGADDGDSGAFAVDQWASAILTFGPDLARKTPNLLFGFHIDETWNGGAARIEDFLNRARSSDLALFVSEYGGPGWADSSPAIDAMLAVCKARHIGRCAAVWSPSDNQRLCAPYDRPGGWQVDTTDGSKPSNLSWLGDRVWDDNHSLVPLHGPELDRSAWTATASSSPMTDSGLYNQPDTVFSPYISADDGWTTNKPEEPGEWFQIDMGARRTFSRLMIDPRGRFNDYPRGYELYVSNDGVTWGAPIAHGRNDQSILRLTFPTQTARFIRVVQTGKAGNYWSIANFEVYAPLGSRAPAAPEPPAAEAAIEPRAWTAGAGPNRWWDVDAPLRPQGPEYRSTANGRPQRPGEYYQVDMGETQRFNRLVLNVGRSLIDYPRGYEVQVSADGLDWGKPVASGRGAPITTITFPAQSARFVRVTLTRHARNYWTLAAFRVYGESRLAAGAAELRSRVLTAH
jgi:mannan endo-1,4-beta-mannosidase